ncbi:MAG: PHP domain-containing protein [Armatimonadota bacterium]
MSFSTPRKNRECRHWWFDAWDWLANQALAVSGLSQVEAGPAELALDPHIHTLYSHCSVSEPEGLLRAAARLGLGGVGIMDHHRVKGALETVRCAEDLKRRGLLDEEFLVIPGVELNSSVGHIGALFVCEDLPEGLSPERTVEAIHQAGGLAIAVHPYHSTGIGDAVFDAPFDAVEVECGSVFDRELVRRNRDLAEDKRLGAVAKIGGSDAHYRNAIASCYTLLAVDNPTLEAARLAIEAARCAARSSESLARMRKVLGLIPKLR